MADEIPAIQALPSARTRWRRDADVVVVGSGAAGISAALSAAASGLRVLMVTKDLIGGATPLAQGGLAAAIGPGDSAAAHAGDTLAAGAGLCESEVVAALAAGASGTIEWLSELGAHLETRELRLEGGHSKRRIVHSGDDATGAEVHRVLLAALLSSGIEILDRTVAVDLILPHTDPAELGGRLTESMGTRDGHRAPLALKVRPPITGQSFSAGQTFSTNDPDLGGLDPADGGWAGIGTGRWAMDGAAAANADPDGVSARWQIPAHAMAPLASGSTGRGGQSHLGVVPDHRVAGLRPGAVPDHRVAGLRPGAVPDHRVAGLVAAAIGPDGRLAAGVISARAVVVAAGGLGQAFATTSNPSGATGDGIALAARAGAVLRDLEFVQFHPTVLWLPGASGQCPLITEALRGAGAVLRDLDGTPLMTGHDPRGDLAPRDVVAARMAEVIAAGTAGHVWLDATGLGRDALENGFPTVTAACRKHGIDPVTEYIPVAPGAHYSCGGIRADLDGRTSIPGLYAVGEAASSGVQGANRLASNSVTEAIIAGRRAGNALEADTLEGRELASETPIPRGLSAEMTTTCGLSPEITVTRDFASEKTTAGDLAPEKTVTRDLAPEKTVTRDLAPEKTTARDLAPEKTTARDLAPEKTTMRHFASEKTTAGDLAPEMTTSVGVLPLMGVRDSCKGAGGPVTAGCGNVTEERRGLAAAMSRYAGVLRDAEGLTLLAAMTSGADVADGEPVGTVLESGGGLEFLEAANLRTVSALIAAGALRRAESRGCHRRRDAVMTAERPWHTLMRWDGRELVVTEGEL